MCSLDWQKYKSDPALYPMFKDHLTVSGCAGDQLEAITFTDLEASYKARKCDVSPHGLGCSPSGLVFHSSRCGSTLLANLLASLPGSITYSESVPPALVLMSSKLGRADKVHALRVIVAAMGAPLIGEGSGIGMGSTTGVHSPAMYFKLQSMLSLDIDIWREAFPSTPWLFVHREGVEILASLFRGQSPTGDAGTLQGSSSRLPPQLQIVPCLRGAQRAAKATMDSPEFALQFAVAGVTRGADFVRLPPEFFCAAQVASYAASAVANILHARLQAWGAAGKTDELPLDKLTLPHPAWLALLGGSPLGGALAAEGLALDYSGLPHSAIEAIATHFGVDIGDDLHAQLLRVAARYSKARVAPVAASEDTGAAAGREGGTASGNLRASTFEQVQASAIGTKGWKGPDRSAAQYVDDSQAKQAAAWDGLRQASASYVQPWRTALLGLSGDAGKEEGGEAHAAPSSADAAASVEALLASVRGVRRVPFTGAIPAPSATLALGHGYPALFPLADILTYWSADIVSVPPDYGRYSSLRVFDWRVPAERAEAEVYRRAEVPFVVRHVPSLDATAQAWGSDEGLMTAVGGPAAQHEAEINVAGSNHFMYWNKARARKDKAYTPPTKEGKVKAGDWLAKAHAIQEAVVEEEKAQLPSWWFSNSSSAQGEAADTPSLPPLGTQRSARELWYMRISTDQRNLERHAFIHKSLTFLSPEGSAASKSDPDRRFFLVDEAQQRGIHCRFGQPGIIAEAHYDGGRNFINMVRGSKRYILAPPSECSHMALLKDGPSARHSAADWSDPASWPADSPLYSALGLELILHAGDSLYVPALWFHYIISLEVNVQCNTRSGTPRMYEAELAACGFSSSFTEALGQYTDTEAPSLQPSRAKHMEVWRKAWPQESVEGLLGGAPGPVGPSAYVRQLAASVALSTGRLPPWATQPTSRLGLQLAMDPSAPGGPPGASTAAVLQPQVASVLSSLLPSLPSLPGGEGTGTAAILLHAVVQELKLAPAPSPPGLQHPDTVEGDLAVPDSRGSDKRPLMFPGTFAAGGGATGGRMGAAQLRAEALLTVLRGSMLWVAVACACLMLAVVARLTGLCRVRSTVWRVCCCWLCCASSSPAAGTSAGYRPGTAAASSGRKRWQQS